MKIDKVGLDKIHMLGVPNKSARNSMDLRPDVSLKISELAKKISKLHESVPADEVKRIDRLRSMIHQGEYKIDSDKIARVLLALREQDK